MATPGNKQHYISQSTYTKRQYLLIIVIGIMLCMLAGLVTINIGLSYTEKEFHAKADLVYDEITRRYSTLEAVLTSLAGFHQASDHVSAVQFSTFAQELLNAYPYIRSAVSLHKLDHSDRLKFEREMQDRGYYQFSVTESDSNGGIVNAEARSEYLIINIIEPLLPQMGSLLGFDIFTISELTNAVVKASRTGKGAASPVTNLLRKDGSIMVFKAVYQGRYSPNSENERIAMFTGAIAMEVGADILQRDIIPAENNFNVSLSHRSDNAEHTFANVISNSKADSNSNTNNKNKTLLNSDNHSNKI